MKKMRDERLIFENLKNIRMAFLIQTLGILVILIVDGMQNGYEQAKNNPLWLLFLITGIVLGYSRLRISVESEVTTKPSQQRLSYSRGIIRSVALGFAGFLAIFLTSKNLRDAIILGIVLAFSFLIPAIIIIYFRKKNTEDEHD